MIRASCHCGEVVLDIAEAPSEITECNCSICRRYGVLWAYYAPEKIQVRAGSGTDAYMWDDRSIAFHRCRTCGCVTHWSAVGHKCNRMGVNARLIAPEVLGRARVRHLDGATSEAYLD